MTRGSGRRSRRARHRSHAHGPAALEQSLRRLGLIKRIRRAGAWCALALIVLASIAGAVAVCGRAWGWW